MPLFLSGLFLTEVIFLMPFMAPFYLFFVILIYYNLRPRVKKYLLYVMLFSVPLILAESVWTIRNYIKTDQFIPFAATKGEDKLFNKSIYEQIELTKNCGKTFEWWVNDSPMKWFADSLDMRHPGKIFPKYIVKPGHIADSIIRAKKYYQLSKDTLIPLNERIRYESLSACIIRNIRENYKNNYPIKYHIMSRLKLLIDFINQPIKRPLISIKYPLNVVSVYLEAFICYFTFFWGCISLLWGLFHFRKNPNAALVLSIPIFIFILFPVIFQFREYREMYMAFPFLLFAGICSLTEVKLKPLFKKIYISAVLAAFVFYAVYYTINNIKW